MLLDEREKNIEKLNRYVSFFTHMHDELLVNTR
jgi:hypothetical protein